MIVIVIASVIMMSLGMSQHKTDSLRLLVDKHTQAHRPDSFYALGLADCLWAGACLCVEVGQKCLLSQSLWLVSGLMCVRADVALCGRQSRVDNEDQKVTGWN